MPKLSPAELKVDSSDIEKEGVFGTEKAGLLARKGQTAIFVKKTPKIASKMAVLG